VNFLGVTGSAAFPVLGRLGRDGVCIDAYWADDARIDERRGAAEQADAEDIRRMRDRSAWQGLYFGGTAFKKQRAVAAGQYAEAARLAAQFMDVVCTSGAATGCAAEIGKIKTFRAAIGDRPLALASGITPGNARDYCADVDCFMVATGINDDGDFYNISAAKLTELLATTRDYGAHK
jgi:predicted TIM-barrel enzyme